MGVPLPWSRKHTIFTYSAPGHGKCQTTSSSQCHHVEAVVTGEEIPGHPLASRE